jgi:hypothetical protein
MVERAKQRLQYKAALHPILFELLPEKFTIPSFTIFMKESMTRGWIKETLAEKCCLQNCW